MTILINKISLLIIHPIKHKPTKIIILCTSIKANYYSSTGTETVSVGNSSFGEDLCTKG